MRGSVETEYRPAVDLAAPGLEAISILNIFQGSNYWIFATQVGVILAEHVLVLVIGGRALAEQADVPEVP